MRVSAVVVVVLVVACGREQKQERVPAEPDRREVAPPAAAQPKSDEPAPQRAVDMLRKSKMDMTKIRLAKYAFEAYPSWAASHPDKACPEKLTDLNEYMSDGNTSDAWGRPLKMICGYAEPSSGIKGLGVMSFGEDGKEGTADDLRSWD